MNSNIDGGKTLSSARSQPMQGNHSFISERDLGDVEKIEKTNREFEKVAFARAMRQL